MNWNHVANEIPIAKSLDDRVWAVPRYPDGSPGKPVRVPPSLLEEHPDHYSWWAWDETQGETRERVERWARITSHGKAAAEVLALLDTSEAKPASQGVTREDVIFAAALAGGIARGHSEEAAIRNAKRYVARLRGEEKS